MDSQYIETDIIERLTHTKTLRGYFICAVDILNAGIDILVQTLFRQDDFAVTNVVKPLLEVSGPLYGLSVRLKLIFGLGLISQSLYQDITKIVNVRDLLNKSDAEYSFTSPDVLFLVSQIQSVQEIADLNSMLPKIEEEVDPIVKEMQLHRRKQIVESTLSLAIANMYDQVCRSSIK